MIRQAGNNGTQFVNGAGCLGVTWIFIRKLGKWWKFRQLSARQSSHLLGVPFLLHLSLTVPVLLLTSPHFVTLDLATCLMATRAPLRIRTPAYTVPKPPCNGAILWQLFSAILGGCGFSWCGTTWTASRKGDDGWDAGCYTRWSKTCLAEHLAHAVALLEAELCLHDGRQVGQAEAGLGGCSLRGDVDRE